MKVITSIAAFAFLGFFTMCKGEKQIPVEINKKLVISAPCDLLAFSANRGKYFAPEIIRGGLRGSGKKETTTLEIESNKSTYPQSFSCDCKKIAVLLENSDDIGYSLILYDINNKQHTLIGPNGGISSAVFSPNAPHLAYIEGTSIRIYDYLRKTQVSTSSKTIRFRSLNWTSDGLYLLLEDLDSNVWKYNISAGKYTELVHAKSYFWGSRNITLDNSGGDAFFYLSDEVSGFNDIFHYSKGKSGLVYMSMHDKYLLQTPQSLDNLYFRSTEDGNMVIKNYRNNKLQQLTKDGVYFDFYTAPNKTFVTLYSDYSTPATVLIKQGVNTIFLGPNSERADFVRPQTYKNTEGMGSYVYQSSAPKQKWAVYLHGGPWEEYQVRYNVYIQSLLKNGISIIALNYLGSTGAGNKYESREDAQLDQHQIQNIARDLREIRIKYRIRNPISLIGVSYGAFIANKYAAKYPDEVNKVVDFSGVADKFYPFKSQRLYIYGEDDFMLDNPGRTGMLAQAKSAEAKIVILKNEGHNISQRQNIKTVIREISHFLQQ